MGHSTGVDKDKRSRQKINICQQQMGELLYMIVGDNSYQTRRNWTKRIELVNKAKEQLKDPEMVLKRLKLLMEPIILEQRNSGLDVRKTKSALEEIQSSLLQSKNIVFHPDSIPPNDGVLEIEDDRPRETSKGSDFNHRIGGWETSASGIKSGNKKTNQEMGDNFELDSTNGGLSDGLSLAEMLGLPVPEDWYYPLVMDTYFDNVLVEDSTVVKATSDLDEGGTSNTVANEVNVRLPPPDETCIVKSYKVFCRNADALNEIFQRHPEIDEKFRVAHSDFQSFCMNSLAEVYQEIIILNKQEMLELKDIEGMELKVKDMEITGLQLTWLKKMLEEVHERSENQAEQKRLLEVISSCRAEEEEAQQKLARLEKKPRFW